MNRVKDKGKMPGAVLMMLLVGMAVYPRLSADILIPSDTSIGTWDGATYTLKANITVSDTIVITVDNLTLDGNKDSGTKVSITTASDGVAMDGRTDVTVTNTAVEKCSRGIYLKSCTGCTLEDNTLSGNTYGIYLQESGGTDLENGNKIIGNTATGNSDGIYLYLYSHYNTIKENDASSNTKNGIFLNSRCDYNEIIDNTANLNTSGSGIAIWDLSDYSVLADNTVSGNLTGIELKSSSSHQTIVRNVISGSTTGLSFGSYCNSNKIYNNNFINNTTQVEGIILNNTYSLDSPIGGNYWSDYTTSTDGNGDGFLDDPLTGLPGSSVGDLLPLAAEYSGPMIAPVIVFFDECSLIKDPPTIVGIDTGTGRTAAKRLAAFRDLLVKVQDLILEVKYDLACKKLDKALALCDPDTQPPDLITHGTSGEEDLDKLKEMIDTLKELLGCPSP